MNDIVSRPRDTYQWRSGCHFRADANEIGRRLELLAELNDGQLTTEVVAYEATLADSPLYDLFEHDITLAANEYIKAQARNIVNSLVIVTVIPPQGATTSSRERFVTVDITIEEQDEIEEGEPVQVRAFPSVFLGGTRCYTPIQAVLSNGTLRDQYAKRILQELKTLAKRASDFRIFSEVVKAIAALPDNLETENAELSTMTVEPR